MNALASQIARGIAAIVALCVCCVAALGGAGLEQVALRSGAAFIGTWIGCDLAAKVVLKTLLRRALEDSKTGQVDVTLR